MTIIGLLLIFISYILFIIGIVTESTKSDISFIFIVLTVICSIVGIVLFGVGVRCDTEEKYNKNYIPAIEVYRGNTDLLITYNDTIPVDSVVKLKIK